MFWKCPRCSKINEEFLLECLCGFNVGRDEQIKYIVENSADEVEQNSTSSKFENREEYERWKAQKIKENEREYQEVKQSTDKRKKNQEIPRVAGRRTKVIYYSIFSVFIIAGIGAFSINYFRYETAAVGRWDLKYDKFDGIVYRKFALKPDAPWKETKFKSLRQATFILEQRLREEAAENATDEIKGKLDDIENANDEIKDKLDDIQEKQNNPRQRYPW